MPLNEVGVDLPQVVVAVVMPARSAAVQLLVVEDADAAALPTGEPESGAPHPVVAAALAE